MAGLDGVPDEGGEQGGPPDDDVPAERPDNTMKFWDGVSGAMPSGGDTAADVPDDSAADVLDPHSEPWGLTLPDLKRLDSKLYVDVDDALDGELRKLLEDEGGKTDG